MKIAIDAGHGVGNAGAAANGLREDDVVLDLAERLGHIWRERHGSESTLMIRPGIKHVPNELRARMALRAGCRAFISLHCNAAGDRRARGFSCWILAGDPRDARLARAILDSYRAAEMPMPIYGAGIYPDTRSHVRSICVLRRSGSMPAVLLECGFLSNSGDARLLQDRRFRQRLMEVVARGIENYLGVSEDPADKSPAGDPNERAREES